MEYIASQKISNDPIFTSVERIVNVYRIEEDYKRESALFYFSVFYKEGGSDVTHKFRPAKSALIVDKSMRVLLRDEEGEVVPNPEFDPNNFDEENPATEYDMNLHISGWEMIKNINNSESNKSEIIKQYILINDADNFFN